jgi:hypothetical protein
MPALVKQARGSGVGGRHEAPHATRPASKTPALRRRSEHRSALPDLS